MKPRDRLVRLLEHVVPRIVPDKFDMSTWLELKLPIPDEVNPPYPETPMPGDCKTTACLAGWGASDPLLQAEGLEFRQHYVGGRYWQWVITTGQGHINLGKFFGISEDVAQLLFYTATPPDEDPRPVLAARIRFALDHPYMDVIELAAELPRVSAYVRHLPYEQAYHPVLRANEQSLGSTTHWDPR